MNPAPPLSPKGEKPAPPFLVIIGGPTGTGKSDLAVRLAGRLADQGRRAEILNGDSRQQYRGVVIGTAKPAVEARGGIPHHLYDRLDPVETSSAGAYAAAATSVIREVHARGAIPIVVGGTGLYLRALAEGMCETPPRRPELRRELEAEGRVVGPASLHSRLAALDPVIARKIPPENMVRVIRALEVCLTAGEPFSEIQKRTVPPAFPVILTGIGWDRRALSTRLNNRVERMLEDGWPEEVRSLLDGGVPETCPAFEAVGYRAVAAMIGGRMSRADAVWTIQKDTRQYAKRQITWFSRQRGFNWFTDKPDEQVEHILINYIK